MADDENKQETQESEEEANQDIVQNGYIFLYERADPPREQELTIDLE